MIKIHFNVILTVFLALLITFTIISCNKPNQRSNVCKELAPVKFQGYTICVTRDYYMIGKIRTPVDMPTAREIAETKKMLLPNPDIVDAIWEQANIRLTPISLVPSTQMTSREYYVKHNTLIDEQLLHHNIKNKLIAGHKKDIVYISRNSSRVAIYGWHRLNGQPIQPYSTIHGKYYYDYSHGLRLVSPIAYDSENNPVDLKKIITRG